MAFFLLCAEGVLFATSMVLLYLLEHNKLGRWGQSISVIVFLLTVIGGVALEAYDLVDGFAEDGAALCWMMAVYAVALAVYVVFRKKIRTFSQRVKGMLLVGVVALASICVWI